MKDWVIFLVPAEEEDPEDEAQEAWHAEGVKNEWWEDAAFSIV